MATGGAPHKGPVMRKRFHTMLYNQVLENTHRVIVASHWIVTKARILIRVIKVLKHQFPRRFSVFNRCGRGGLINVPMSMASCF